MILSGKAACIALLSQTGLLTLKHPNYNLDRDSP